MKTTNGRVPADATRSHWTIALHLIRGHQGGESHCVDRGLQADVPSILDWRVFRMIRDFDINQSFTNISQILLAISRPDSAIQSYLFYGRLVVVPTDLSIYLPSSWALREGRRTSVLRPTRPCITATVEHLTRRAQSGKFDDGGHVKVCRPLRCWVA
jgi:hypothetical protein